jgi:hypothetical protein
VIGATAWEDNAMINETDDSVVDAAVLMAAIFQSIEAIASARNWARSG